jgi:hypothetical protein
MDKLQRVLHAAHVQYQREQGAGDQPKAKITYRPALSANERYQPTPEQYAEGYYRLFCIHHRAMWEPCPSKTCRRDSHEAKNNFVKLTKGRL